MKFFRPILSLKIFAMGTKLLISDDHSIFYVIAPIEDIRVREWLLF